MSYRIHNLAWIVFACALTYLPFAAEAQFPRPRPASAQQAQQAPVAKQAPAQAEPREIVVPAPQVTVQTAPPQSDFFNYIFAGLGTVFTALFGFNVFKSSGGSIPKLTPEARAAIDAAAIKAVESGLPGQAVTAGLGLIPGAGSIASLVEPLARRAALAALNERLATNQSGVQMGNAGDVLGTPIAAAVLNENILTNLADKLAERIKARIAA